MLLSFTHLAYLNVLVTGVLNEIPLGQSQTCGSGPLLMHGSYESKFVTSPTTTQNVDKRFTLMTAIHHNGPLISYI